MLIIQYLFDGEEHSVTPAQHGNTRKTKTQGYIRTKPSALERIKEVAQTTGPRGTYHRVSEEKGGLLHAASASDLPRNREQAKNHRAGSEKSSKKVDSLAILLEECKRQQMSLEEEQFIREVTGAPELKCVLAYDWQLEEIKQFCTDPSEFCTFTADPTFNLGAFNLTVTTYRNLKVVTRRDGNNPLMIGPLLLSQTKTAECYKNFFAKLASLNGNLSDVLAFGTDGEEPLIEGMRNTMRYAIHIRCFGHFRDNCKTKLRQSNVPDNVQQTFLDDIFGKRHGETFKKGKTH